MFSEGGAVAVMPIGSESSQDAICTATVRTVSEDCITLIDGRRYCLQEELWTDEEGVTYIVPATAMHIRAVHAKCARYGTGYTGITLDGYGYNPYFSGNSNVRSGAIIGGAVGSQQRAYIGGAIGGATDRGRGGRWTRAGSLCAIPGSLASESIGDDQTTVAGRRGTFIESMATQ